MKHCPKCNIDLPDANKFCRSCGGPIAEKLVVAETQPAMESGSRCPNCGTVVKPGWKACAQCGAQLQAATPPVQQPAPAQQAFASQGSQTICRVCGKANRAGMRFCEGCGNMLESQPLGAIPQPGASTGAGAATDPDATRRTALDPSAGMGGMPGGGISPGSIPSSGMPTAAGNISPLMGGAAMSAAGAAIAPAPCGKCGAMLRPGLNFCEVCGTPAGYIQEPREPRSYKWLIAVAIVVVVLGGAALGYHFWGVKMTVAVGTDPAGMSEVYLDGERLGSTEGRMVINHILRGEHTLLVKRDGFDDYTTKVSLGLFDFAKTVDVNLRRTTFAFSIKGLANDGKTKILLEDPEDRASGPQEVGEWDNDKSAYVVRNLIKDKSYTITVKRAGYKDFKQSVKLSANDEKEYDWTIGIAGDWGGTYSETIPSIDPNGTATTSTPTEFTLSLSETSSSNKYRLEFKGTMQSGYSYDVSGGSVMPGYLNSKTTTTSSSKPSISFDVEILGTTFRFTGNMDIDLMGASGTWTQPYNYPSKSGTWSMKRNQASTAR